MKKIFSILLTIVFMFSAMVIVGCDDKPSEKNTQDTFVSSRVLADFEQWNPDFQQLKLGDMFGKVTRNENADYVKSGKYSAKLQPIGNYSYSLQAELYIPTYSNSLNYDYRSVDYLRRVTMWMYNAQEQVKNVTVGLVSKIRTYTAIDLANGDSFSLNSGWNYIEYFVDLSVINMITPLEEAPAIYLAFENAGTRNVEEAPVYYLDDVQLRYSNEKQEVIDLVEFDDGEICDFEKLYQQYVIQKIVPSTKAYLSPEISVVKAENEILSQDETSGEKTVLNATSGDYVLKCVPVKSQMIIDDYGYPGIDVPAAIMERTKLTKLDKSEYSDYNICFDVFNFSSKEIKIYISFYEKDKWVVQTFTKDIPINEWSTVSIKLSDVDATKIDLSKMGTFRTTWREYDDVDDRILFFDNFRIERCENEN